MKEITKNSLTTLDEITDKYIGKKGAPKREKFEYELRIQLLGEAVKQARHERKLTQEQLGKLVGVQKSQISKIENNFTNARFDTVMRVFDALKAKVNFNVQLPKLEIQL